MTALIKSPEFVQFNGSRILVTMQDGEPYVAIRPICDALGLAWNGQYERLNRDEVLKEGVRVIRTPSTGGVQDTTCLPLSMLNGWLFGVDDKRVKEEARPKLLHYKRECYKALHQHFFGEVARPVTVKSHRRALPSPAPKTVLTGSIPDTDFILNMHQIIATANRWVKQGLFDEFSIALERALFDMELSRNSPLWRPSGKFEDRLDADAPAKNTQREIAA